MLAVRICAGLSILIFGSLSAHAASVQADELSIFVGGPVGSLAGDAVVPLPWDPPIPIEEPVLWNPAGELYRSYASTPAASLPARFAMNEDATYVYHPVPVGTGRFMIPWYYVMDDDEIHPALLLNWDTSTLWYLDYAEILHDWTRDIVAERTGIALLDTAPLLEAARESVPVIRFTFDGSAMLFDHDLPAGTSPASESAALVGAEAEDVEGQTRPAADANDPGATAGERLVSASSSIGFGASKGSETVGLSSEPPAVQDFDPQWVSGLVAFLGLAAAGYHMLRRRSLLENGVRSRILQSVQERPGGTVTDLARAANVRHQTALYHIELLLAGGMIVETRRGKRRHFFANNGEFNPEERAVATVAKDEGSMQILALVRENPELSKSAVAAKLAISKNTVNWHLKKLAHSGLVVAEPRGGAVLLRARPEGLATLERVSTKLAAIPAAATAADAEKLRNPGRILGA